MRFGAFVITFRRPQIVAETLRQVFAQTRAPERVIVVDNDPDESARPVAEALGERAHYHAAGENLGPAGAAAVGLRWLRDEGYDWAYWIDDDDPPLMQDCVERLFALLEGDVGKVGALGTVGHPWNWQRGVIERFSDAELRGPMQVDVIGGNQQLLVSTEAAEAVGYPDARLFFGLEEPDFCLRLRRAGYAVMIDGDLAHEARRLTGRLDLQVPRRLTPSMPRDALWREYYSTRNYVFLMRETFQRPDLAWRYVGRSLAKVLLSWGRGPGYGWDFTRLELAAIRDGYAGRMGARVLPKR